MHKVKILGYELPDYRVVEIPPTFIHEPVGPSFELLQAAQEYREAELNDREGERYEIVESK
jgi:hypothetical protein